MSSAADFIKDATRPWKHGEHLDARGLILDEPLVLDGLTVRGFDLTGAQLRGGLSARGTRFLGLAWLRDARVEGVCDLSDTRFRNDLRADGMTAGTMRLSSCYLEGVLSLARAHLASLALDDAVIMANLTLEDARIEGAADFSRAELLGGFCATGARLGRLLDTGTEISGRVRPPA